MNKSTLSRRQFARTAAAALGAWVAVPRLAGAGSSSSPPPAAPSSTVRIDSNENPYGPSSRALEAINRAEPLSSRYPDNPEEEMIAALARLHSVGTDSIILGCGYGEILQMADMAFLGADRTVVAAEPTFEAVLAYARVTRARAIKVPLTPDHRHDLTRMAAACDNTTGLVYLCNPNNPTGTIVTREEMAAFFDRVPRSAVILVDEAYHHFVEDSRYATALEWLGKVPRLLVVRTFSKIYGLAGLRLGYAVASEEVIGAMRPHRAWSNANALVLAAARASLEEPDHVPRTRRAMNQTREWLCAEMQKDGRATIPSQANFVMIDLRTDVAPIIAALKERGVYVGRKFPSLPNWLRVSIGTPEEMRRFVGELRTAAPVPASSVA
jgi:histidinol-phosphate aminotransferase